MVSTTIKARALMAIALMGLASFAYAGAAGPTIQGIAPNRGPTSGGRTFRIRGSGFDALPAGTLGVLFGDAAATEVEKRNDRDISGRTPAHPAGTVIVYLSIDGEAYTAAGSDAFEFIEGGTAECTTADECDDANPCTVDTCATTCQSAPVDSADDLTGRAPGCAGLVVPAKIGKKFVSGCKKLVLRDSAPNDRKRAKLRTKAIKSFVKAATKAGKTKAIEGACASELGVLLEDARVYAESQ
jgi:hypothetical protein